MTKSRVARPCSKAGLRFALSLLGPFRTVPSQIVGIFIAAALPVLWGGLTPASASVLDPGLGLIERGYLFFAELDADRLLGEALEYTEGRIPGVRAESLGERAYLLTAGDCELRIETPPDCEIRDLEFPLETAAGLIERCVTELPKDLQGIDAVLLNGVLSGLDPYSTVLGTRSRTEHRIQFQGKLGGIGARIGTRNDELTLITVYPDSPADQAGLQDNDTVLRIDDLSATNILVSDAVERIRGEEGTEVVLAVRREGEAEPLEIAVTRGVVVIPSVTAKLHESGIIQAEITHFSQTTPSDFEERVGEVLRESPEATGVVVDLRRNSGGSMLGSSAIADLFLRSGVLITTAGRHGNAARGLSPEVRATRSTPFADLSVAFLTSSRTASGSELLAASLRYNDRAILVGQRSYGKGTIQKTYSLGAENTLKLTVGHFLPSGRPIPGGGLIPDIEVSTYRFREGGVVIPPTRSNKDLPFWLQLPRWADGGPTRAKHSIVRAEVAPETEKGSDEETKSPKKDADKEDPLPDPEMDLAAAVLARFGSTRASDTLAAAESFLAEREAQADATVSAFMSERGINWASSEERPEDSAPNAEFKIETAKALKAGEEATITATLRNLGDKPIARVRGILESTGVLHGRAMVFGTVAPGASATWEFQATPAAGLRTSRAEITARLHDETGPLPELGPITLGVEAGMRPHLAYRHSVTAQPDSALEIAIELENRGAGTLKDLRVRLNHPLNGEFEIVDGAAKVDALEPGEQTKLNFHVKLLGTFDDAPELTALLAEASYGIYMEPKIRLSPGAGTESWVEPPRIEIQSMQATAEDGNYLLRVSVSDDTGLETVEAAIDGDLVEATEPQGQGVRQINMKLPWHPSDGVKSFRIIATDEAGHQAFYYAEL